MNVKNETRTPAERFEAFLKGPVVQIGAWITA